MLYFLKINYNKMMHMHVSSLLISSFHPQPSPYNQQPYRKLSREPYLVQFWIYFKVKNQNNKFQ